MKNLVVMFILLMAVLPVLSESNLVWSSVTNPEFNFKIRSVLLAPRGWWRLGKSGCGDFFGYSFGRTIYHGTNEITRVEGNTKFLEIRNFIENGCSRNELMPDMFESAFLWLEKSSRRLIRVELLSKQIPFSDIDDVVKSMIKKIDYGLALPLVRMDVNGKSYKSDKPNPISIFRAEDTMFSVQLVVYSLTNSMARVSISATSKKLLIDSESSRITTIEPDLQIEVDGL